jgi:hypothetical protein
VFRAADSERKNGGTKLFRRWHYKNLHISEIKIHITRARMKTPHDLLPETVQQLARTAAGTLFCSMNDVMRGNAD